MVRLEKEDHVRHFTKITSSAKASPRDYRYFDGATTSIPMTRHTSDGNHPSEQEHDWHNNNTKKQNG
eukprot:scaffold137800_cov41-Attheya_sp.AAC.2